MNNKGGRRKAEQLKQAVKRLFQAQVGNTPGQTMLSIAYSTDPQS